MPEPKKPHIVIGGSVGQWNQGVVVENINSHIAAVSSRGDERVTGALQRLRQAAVDDPELDDQTRKDVLAMIQDLAQDSEAQPEDRKRHRVEGAIAAITVTAGAAAKLGEAWQQWGRIVTDHFRLP